MARYGLGMAAMRLAPGAAWPWATLTVNVVGGLAAGLLVGWLAHRGEAHGESLRLLLGVGLLGGFTTFSAFSIETLNMIQRRDWTAAGLYVGLSVVLAIAAVFVGLMLARRAFA